MIIPIVAGAPVGSMINGQLFRHFQNPQYIMLAGALILAGGCGALATLTIDTPLPQVALLMSLCGLGLGFLLSNYNLVMQMVVDHAEVGVGTALIQTTRAFGSAIGTTLVGLAVAHSSVLSGVQVSLVGCVVLCGITAYLTLNIRVPKVE